MATYKEITYMCLDELKMTSDDSHFTEEHIIFLADKYRCFLLTQRYKDVRKEIPDSNYQTICVDLEQGDSFDNCSDANYMKSVQKIPNMLQVGASKISSMDFFQGNFSYVSNERFKYAGSNKYLQNQIYGTIAPDHHLYLKSSNNQIFYLDKVRVTGIFEDVSQLTDLQCPDEQGETTCDILDTKFPLEEGLIPNLIELIVKELSGAKYQAADDKNNAADDLGDLANYIARNMKNDWQRNFQRD